jgi:hypothetical protein
MRLRVYASPSLGNQIDEVRIETRKVGRRRRLDVRAEPPGRGQRDDCDENGEDNDTSAPDSRHLTAKVKLLE